MTQKNKLPVLPDNPAAASTRTDLISPVKKGNVTVKQDTTCKPNFSIWGECQKRKKHIYYVRPFKRHQLKSNDRQFFKNQAFPDSLFGYFIIISLF